MIKIKQTAQVRIDDPLQAMLMQVELKDKDVTIEHLDNGGIVFISDDATVLQKAADAMETKVHKFTFAELAAILDANELVIRSKRVPERQRKVRRTREERAKDAAIKDIQRGVRKALGMIDKGPVPKQFRDQYDKLLAERLAKAGLA